MKKVLLLILLLSVGCTSSTPHGKCVGAFEDKNPKKIYEVSTKNVILATVFFQTLFTPILVILNQTYCPVGDK